MDALRLSTVSALDAEIAALLQSHFDLMRSNSPPESCHVLAPGALFEDAAVVITARGPDGLLGIGALKSLDPSHGELKSMHTLASARGRGVGKAVLDALIAHARTAEHNRVSLETGSADDFAPARALYANAGFVECPPFGAYQLDPLSVFMTKPL